METIPPAFTGPTHRGLEIASVDDALRIIECCRQGHPEFPQVTHRMDHWQTRKELITSGTVFVFEVKRPLIRWTDDRRWGQNQQYGDFYRYIEAKPMETVRSKRSLQSSSAGDRKASERRLSPAMVTRGPYQRPTLLEKQDPLLKYTYTVHVADPSHPDTKSKWEIVWYFQPCESTSTSRLVPVAEHHVLRAIVVPDSLYSPVKSKSKKKSPKSRSRTAWAERDLPSPSTSHRHSTSSYSTSPSTFCDSPTPSSPLSDDYFKLPPICAFPPCCPTLPSFSETFPDFVKE